MSAAELSAAIAKLEAITARLEKLPLGGAASAGATDGAVFS